MRLCKRILIVISCIFLFGLSLTACGDSSKITGDQWLLLQSEYFPDIQAFSKGLDEVYTLYIMEAISAEDFAQELTVLQQQYDIMQAVYEKEKSRYTIKPESYSYIAQKGMQGMDGIRILLGGLLEDAYDPNGQLWDPTAMSYLYLEYQDQFAEAFAQYITAYQMICDMYEVQDTQESASETPIGESIPDASQ